MTNTYKFGTYLGIARWNSYWYQLNETLSFSPKTVLIIGVGDNIVGSILAKQGVDVCTFDFDENLHPDIVGNVSEIEKILQKRSFDVILCCQVLEHLPYDYFERILRQMKALARRVIISLPYSYIYYKLEVKLPIVKTVRMNINIHQFYRRLKLGGEHYWEIGFKGYPKRKIMKSINKFFAIKKHFVVPNNHYHIFFILSGKE